LGTTQSPEPSPLSQRLTRLRQGGRPEVTSLPPGREGDFQAWVRQNQITDLDHPQSFYDYRGAFLAGATRDPATGQNWPDPWKQHGHESFSVESQYARPGDPEAGRWEGDRFVSPNSGLRSRLDRLRQGAPSTTEPGGLSARLERMREASLPVASPIEAGAPSPPPDFTALTQPVARDVTAAPPTTSPTYDRFGEPLTPAARAEDDAIRQDAEARQTPLQRTSYNVAKGVGKALAIDLPLGVAHFLSTPLRAVFAPEMPEEARNPLIRAMKMARGGMTPAQTEADVHAALRARAAGAPTPGAVVGEAAKGLVTMGRDAQRAAMPGPNLGNIVLDALTGRHTTDEVIEEEWPDIIRGEQPEAKARAITNLAVLGGLTAAGAKGERTVAARTQAEAAAHAVLSEPGPGGRPVSGAAVPAPPVPTEAPTLRQRLANLVDPEHAQRLQTLEHELRGAQRVAETDPLTGLGNQAAFQRARAAADVDPGTEVVAFDLNNLKALNDVQGHEAGNALIQRTGAAIQASGARGFRTGGDEFLALTQRGQGEALRHAVEQQVGETHVALPNGRTVPASVSGSVGSTFAEADAGLQAVKQARKGGANYREVTPPPSTIVRVPTAEIQADPARFQFKSLGSEGVSGELKGVQRFNEQLAGVVSVWKDPADGRLYVVNGHHRLELAQRLGQPTLNVQFIDAPTAEAARAEGAVINIAEGRGTAVDAAKVMRDMGATPADLLEARGVSVRGDLARDGLALSRLTPDVFDQVATAKVPQGWGVAIGSLLEDPVLQREALTAARNAGTRLSQAEVTELARQVRDAGTEPLTQETLFGTESERHSLFAQKAQLAAAVKRRLASDKRLFGYVSNAARAQELGRAGETQIDVAAARGLAEGSARGAEVFDRLYTRAGAMSEIVNQGARRIAHGEKPSVVAADLYPAIGDAVAQELAASGARAGAVERPVPAGPRAPADEVAAGEAAGRVADSPDIAQGAMFSPARRSPASAPRLPEGRERPPLALTQEPAGPPQATLFSPREGTPAARSLAQTEAAARAEVEGLRRQFVAERDPARKSALAKEIVQRQRLVNRGQAIDAEELRTRAVAEPVGATTGPDQLALLSPVAERTAIGERIRKVTGTSPQEVADVQALVDISRKLADAVSVPLRQGRFQAGLRRAAGVFKPHEEVTRVVRFDQLDTVAHEIGHYVSKKYLRNPTMRSAKFRGAGRQPVLLPKEAARELVQMGRDLYGARKPVGGYGEEGIAEWTSFYVTDPAALTTKARAFSAYMDGVLTQEPALRAALDQARSDFARYQAAPPNQRIAAMLSVDEKVRNFPTVRSLMTAWLDDLSEFRQAMKDLGGAKSPTDDAYVLARLTRGNAGAAEEMLHRGVVKFGTTERVAPSVEETLQSVPVARRQAWREYLAAESALERWAHGINPGITRADADAVATAGRAEFGDASQALWQHGQALIDYRVGAGLLTPEEGARIKAKNQRRVAFYRVFAPEETAGGRGGAGKSFAKSSSGVKAQHGSARRIVDPLESVIRDTYETVAQAHQQQVMTTLVRAAKAHEGGGRIVEEVPAPMRSVAIPVEKVQQQLAELGLVYEGVDAKTGQRFTAPLGGPGGAELEGLLRVFQEARVPGPAEAKDLIVPLIEQGERRWYAVRDRKLYDAVTGLGTPEMSSLVRWLSLPARTLRAGATLTPEFIGRNPVRDAWSSAIYSKASFRPPGYRLAEGLFHYFKADDIYQRWRLAGGDNAAMLGLDRPTTQQGLRQLTTTGAAKGWAVVRHPIETLRLVSAAMENATRVGEFAALERQAVQRGATPEAARTEAALGARDVSLDFARAGTQARAINQIVAFFNASLQGSAQLARELRTRPHVIIPRAIAAITIPSLVLKYLQDDDPVYRDVPRWVKNVSWVYVQRGTDRGAGWDGYGSGKVEHVWMIPKPFELGVLFGTVPERITDYVQEHKPQALTEMATAVGQVFAPPVLPTAVTPLIENYANQSFYRGRPIVPRGREGLDPAEQATPYTSQTARLLGRTLDYAPAKIDNLLRGYTGGLGRYATQGLDAIIARARAAAGLPPVGPPVPSSERDVLTTLPFTKGFTRTVPGEDAESIEQLYQHFEQAERHRRTWRTMLNEGRTAQARAYLERHRDAILSVGTSDELGEGQQGPLRAAYQELQELQAVKRLLDQQPTGTGKRATVTDAMRRLGGLAPQTVP
jgi:diguanylate cyclase (GGDEF)-like protein